MAPASHSFRWLCPAIYCLADIFICFCYCADTCFCGVNFQIRIEFTAPCVILLTSQNSLPVASAWKGSTLRLRLHISTWTLFKSLVVERLMCYAPYHFYSLRIRIPCCSMWSCNWIRFLLRYGPLVMDRLWVSWNKLCERNFLVKEVVIFSRSTINIFFCFPRLLQASVEVVCHRYSLHRPYQFVICNLHNVCSWQSVIK